MGNTVCSLICECDEKYYLCIIIGEQYDCNIEEIYLRELYEKGTSGDKKHRYQPDIVRRYRHCIQLMLNVPDIVSLAKYNSLNYELLKGDKKGISSIRVNDKYRIEFTVKESIEEQIVTICNIIDLSNHYK